MDITTDGGSVARITIHNAWLWSIQPSGMLYGRPFWSKQHMKLMDPPLPPEEE